MLLMRLRLLLLLGLLLRVLLRLLLRLLLRRRTVELALAWAALLLRWCHEHRSVRTHHSL